MNGTKNIIKKELTRVFTDKKIIISLFIMPGVLILVMYSLMGKLISNMQTDIVKHIPNICIQNAPEDLNQVISNNKYEGNITYLKDTDNTDKIKDNIRKGDTDLLVVFDKDFGSTIQNYKKQGDAIPEVKTYYNTSENYSNQARETFLSSVLNVYQQQLLTKRIGNTEQLTIFYIDKDPQSSIIVNTKKAGGQYLSMLLPFLINIMLYQGAMGLGVDAITGEKERGTLSSMLLSPIKRSEIVYGKLISLAILTSISAVIYTVSVIFGIKNLQGGSMGEMGSISLTPVQILQLLVMLLVTVYLYVAMVAAVAVYARTQKEASTYSMPLYIVVMLGSIMTMFSSGPAKSLVYYAIPVYNCSMSIQNLITGDLSAAQFGLTVGTLAVLAAVFTTLITKAFNSEKVMFNA